VQSQHSEQRTLTQATRRDRRATVDADLKRPKHPRLEHSPHEANGNTSTDRPSSMLGKRWWAVMIAR